MKLTKCEECGYEITFKTDVCLNCGEKIHKIRNSKLLSYIKKIFFILIAIYILLSSLRIF